MEEEEEEHLRALLFFERRLLRELAVSPSSPLFLLLQYRFVLLLLILFDFPERDYLQNYLRSVVVDRALWNKYRRFQNLFLPRAFSKLSLTVPSIHE